MVRAVCHSLRKNSQEMQTSAAVIKALESDLHSRAILLESKPLLALKAGRSSYLHGVFADDILSRPVVFSSPQGQKFHLHKLAPSSGHLNSNCLL